MSHGHSRGLGAGHAHGGGAAYGKTDEGTPTTAAGRHRWRLAVAFGLVAAFFGVELAAGLMASSLALISDAGHMAADVVTLGAALVATRIAIRPDRTGRRTFGSYRAEVFASGLAVLIMLGVSVFIAVEAIARIGRPAEPGVGVMLAVGALGLVVNLVCLALLRSGAGESLNVKGAYLEVLADTVGSVGVIAAALLIRATGSPWWDTGIALGIAVFVAVRAIALGREVVAVLGQHAPAGIDPGAVQAALEGVPGVVEVHDLHLWQLTSGMNVATAHLVTADGPSDALSDATSLLRDGFGIAHATLQVETTPSARCEGADW
ncbi:MAG TPA: cation diffusion facilitator family transporter [Phycicoccus sp.]|nr:cation diffusion facilitator family transporter [Phycicoccus sp.]